MSNRIVRNKLIYYNYKLPFIFGELKTEYLKRYKKHMWSKQGLSFFVFLGSSKGRKPQYTRMNGSSAIY
jgi:hypothetical protein